MNSPTATLQGAGTVTFSDNNQNYIVAATTGNQLTIAQNISGPGGDIGNGSLVIVNQSTIDATKSAGTNALTIQPDATLTNTGLLEATGGGSLVLDGGTFTNSGSGAITAGSGSNVTLEGSVTVSGGTLNGAGLFTSLSGTTLNGLTNAGTLQVPNNNSTTLAGTITNTGSLQLNSGGNNSTFFYPSGAVTLTGGGTLTLTDNNNNYIQAAVSRQFPDKREQHHLRLRKYREWQPGFHQPVGGRGGRHFHPRELARYQFLYAGSHQCRYL